VTPVGRCWAYVLICARRSGLHKQKKERAGYVQSELLRHLADLAANRLGLGRHILAEHKRTAALDATIGLVVMLYREQVAAIIEAASQEVRVMILKLVR
jgi:hypothetical protein